jgi:hypothetical protein
MNEMKELEEMMTKIVHVQSVLPYEDTIALKAKTGESSIKEAISKAIYHYIECQNSDINKGKNITLSHYSR